ncbi:hypothetical protein VP01_3619g1 [Puccinia sorghi]|uniref:Uncharacterized protein n=1 Tax=Puccinia sorghi TaxID=27349 RepID=A0A0L6UUW3_9BASI|nr:hypothetical protein VP01_3619g1 [Puccinia sorghi]
MSPVEVLADLFPLSLVGAEPFQSSGALFPSIGRQEKWFEMMQLFERCQGIPQIVGTIYGSHIPLAIPLNDKWKGYIHHCGDLIGKRIAAVLSSCSC